MKINPIVLAMSLAVVAPVAMASDDPRHDRHTDRTDHHDNMNVERPDAWLLTKVKAKFATNETVDATDINVDVVDGRVSLTGTVANRDEHKEAVRLAKETEGVKSVDGSGLRMTSVATDAELEDKLD